MNRDMYVDHLNRPFWKHIDDKFRFTFLVVSFLRKILLLIWNSCYDTHRFKIFDQCCIVTVIYVLLDHWFDKFRLNKLEK